VELKFSTRLVANTRLTAGATLLEPKRRRERGEHEKRKAPILGLENLWLQCGKTECVYAIYMYFAPSVALALDYCGLRVGCL